MSDDGAERLAEAARLYCNWGRWGPNDEVGTVNFITQAEVFQAANLIRRGRVFSLAIPFDQSGPQSGSLRRFNAMGFMLRDGDDVFARAMPGVPRGIGGADDVIIQATHGATHWDALAHIFYDAKMWNGYDCRMVSSLGAEKNDIAAYRDRIVGRAVLLDLPRHLGIPWCEVGQAITAEDLDSCASAQGVEIHPGDVVLLRFGQLHMTRDKGAWGDYAGGDAPGLDFDSLRWVHDREIAGVAADTCGVEVRPNQITYCSQPWHRIALPQIGLL
ncbi:MAG: cyclase family protein, partial [Candidatus Dormiibacterota bacterium]